MPDGGLGDGTVDGVDDINPDPSRLWQTLTWAPPALAAAATWALLWAGEVWVGRLGAPPAHWAWWPAVPVSAFTHLDRAHLAANTFAWWVAATCARRSHLEPRPFAVVFVAGWAAGISAHLATGAAGHLHGASAGICATAAWVAAAGSGRWRAAAAALCAAALIPAPGSSGGAHLAGIAAGAGAALWWHRRGASGRDDGPGTVGHT